MSTNSSNANMITDAKWRDAFERHEMAYFRGQLATSSPESYDIDEMREISEAMDQSTQEVEAMIREDFQSMPLHAQGRMLNLLSNADPGNMGFWNELLGIPAMPEKPPVVA